jgi:hypothetical protein
MAPVSRGRDPAQARSVPDPLIHRSDKRPDHTRYQGIGVVQVVEVSNQSTGYCPDLSCWSAVAAALDRAGLARPREFTHEVVFRRCLSCREVSIVREEEFVCVFCDDDLPRLWNVDEVVR